ncbi:hypothetical protein FRB90_004030 [Tulasnella sp. 427]|nr:hypothetical protein FRB90_004030 [Tulasnella sp. 427]
MVAYRLFHFALFIVASLILVPDTVGDGELSLLSAGRVTPESHRQAILASPNLSIPLPYATASTADRYISDDDTATSMPEENDGEDRIITPSSQLDHFFDTKRNNDLELSDATKYDPSRSEPSDPDGQIEDLPANPRNWNYDQTPKRIDASSVTESSSMYFNAVQPSNFDAVVYLGCVCLLVFCLAIVVFFYLYMLCISQRRRIESLERRIVSQDSRAEFQQSYIESQKSSIESLESDNAQLQKTMKLLWSHLVHAKEKQNEIKRQAEEKVKFLVEVLEDELEELEKEQRIQRRAKPVKPCGVSNSRTVEPIAQPEPGHAQLSAYALAISIYRQSVDAEETNRVQRRSLAMALEQVDLLREERDATRSEVSKILDRVQKAEEIDHQERRELTKALEQVALLHQERDAARAEVATVTNRFENARMDLKREKALALKLVNQANATQTTITRLQDSLDTCQDVVKRTTQDLLQEKNTTMSQLSKMQNRINSLQYSLALSERKTQEAQRQEAKARGDAAPAREILTELRLKLGEAENTVGVLREERDDARKKTSEMSVKIAEIQAELASSKADLESASKQVKRRRKAYTDLNEKIDKIVGSVAKLAEDNTDARKVAHGAQQFEVVRTQLEAEKDKNAQLLRQLEQALTTAKVASPITPPVSAPLYDNVAAPETVPATPAEAQTLDATQHTEMTSNHYDPASFSSGYQYAPLQVPHSQSQYALPSHESPPVTATSEWQSSHLSTEAPATQRWNTAFNTVTPNTPHPTEFPQAGSTPFAPCSAPVQYNVNNFNFAGATSHQFQAGASTVDAEADTEMEIQSHNVAHPSIPNPHWQAPPVTSEAQPAVPVSDFNALSTFAMNPAALQAPQPPILWAVQQALGQVPSGQATWNAYSATNGNDGQGPMGVNQFGQSPFGAANSAGGQHPDVPMANTFSSQEFGSVPPPSGSVASSFIPSAASQRHQEFGQGTAQGETTAPPTQNGTATFGPVANPSYGSTFITNSAVLQHPQPAAVWPAQQSLMPVISTLARWNAFPQANGEGERGPMDVNQLAQPSFSVAGSTEGQQAEVSMADTFPSAPNQEFGSAPPPIGSVMSLVGAPTAYNTPHENGPATVGTTMDPNQAPVANGFGFASNDSPATNGWNGQPSFGGGSFAGGQQPGESTTTTASTVSNPEFESVPPPGVSEASDPVPPSTSRNTPLEADQAVEQAETATPTQSDFGEYEVVSRGAGLEIWLCGESGIVPHQTSYLCYEYLRHRLPDVPSYIWDAIRGSLIWEKIDITQPYDAPESISWDNLRWCLETLRSAMNGVPPFIWSDVGNALDKAWADFCIDFTADFFQPEPGDQESFPTASTPTDGADPSTL